MQKSIKRGVLVVVGFVVAMGVAWCVITQLRTPPPQFRVTTLAPLEDAFFINDKGDAVGDGLSPSGVLHTFIRTKDTPAKELVPCRPHQEIHLVNSGISAAGMVSANCHTHLGMPNDTVQACVWQRNGTCEELGALGGKYSESFGINSAGQVIGQAETGKTLLNGSGPNPRLVPQHHAFLWDGKRMKDLDADNPGNSSALAINDNGDVLIVRDRSNADGSIHRSHHLLHSNGHLEEMQGVRDRDDVVVRMNRKSHLLIVTGPGSNIVWQAGWRIPVWGLLEASGSDMNDKGQVVGVADSLHRWNDWRMPAKTAFLWQNGVMYDLNDLIPSESKIILLHALGINNKSQIVGIGRRTDGESVAFLLTPK